MSKRAGRREQARIHHPVGVHLRTQTDKRWRVARLRDFGWDGACLLTQDPLKADDLVELRMIASGNVGESVLKATVVWTRPPKPGSELNEYGVRFDQTDEVVQATITDAIRQVLSRTDEADKSSERRKARRGPILGCSISIRLSDDVRADWKEVKPTNLSISGMHFCSKQGVLPGSLIAIRLEAPSVEPIILNAKVVWAQPAGPGAMGYGIQINEGNTEQQLLYETFVQFSS